MGGRPRAPEGEGRLAGRRGPARPPKPSTQAPGLEQGLRLAVPTRSARSRGFPMLPLRSNSNLSPVLSQKEKGTLGLLLVSGNRFLYIFFKGKITARKGGGLRPRPRNESFSSRTSRANGCLHAAISSRRPFPPAPRSSLC